MKFLGSTFRASFVRKRASIRLAVDAISHDARSDNLRLAQRAASSDREIAPEIGKSVVPLRPPPRGKENVRKGASRNIGHGFAGKVLQRELERPSFKLSDAKNLEEVQMKRKEIIDNKTTSLETNFEKVKRLKQTDDTRERLEASVALYEYVLPVYKTEYQQLAKLYDEGAAREEIESLAASIETKYRTGFETLFDRLAAGGKPDAARHNIKVNWDVSTAPSF
jgi:hypothetical protein